MADEPASVPQVIAPPNGVAAQVTPPTPKESIIINWWRGRSRTERYLRHLSAITIWTYVFAQLFVFDFDSWLTRNLPGWLGWVVTYKLVVFLFLAAIVLNFVPRRRFWSWTIYILLYPVTRLAVLIFAFVVALGWVVVKLKSWTLLFAILNVTISFFRSFKFNFLLYVIAMIGVLVALLSQTPNNLVSAAALLAAVIIALVTRRLISVFRPSPIFDAYVGVMAWIMDYCRRKLIKPSNATGVDPAQFTLAEFEKRYGDLSTAILLSELCGFLESKFRQYRQSGVAIATYLISLAVLFLIVVVLLGAANYSLYRSDSSAFSANSGHGLFMFIYYAFGAVTGQRISEIYPISTGARWLSILATALSWIFFAGALLSLVLTIKRDQDDVGIERAITRLQQERVRMNQFVEDGFSLKLDQAIFVLENLKGGLSKFIALLREAQQ